ncbi:hypothetical protein [Rhizobium oryzicola]|uniref:Uncharacterized protein n=1 Tax=Rhizobium oryzicola TaxID=1232668 RepID=A0ABT8SVM5_9HYPH|nr:hypothetical protein [Rhizobium oryzicola]MDO1582401.1 hypothetical protein [Rhizobium oryzicola]
MKPEVTIIPFPSHPSLGDRMRQAELAAAAGYLKQAEAALRRAERGDTAAIEEACRMAEGIAFHTNAARGGAKMDHELHHLLATRENRRA